MLFRGRLEILGNTAACLTEVSVHLFARLKLRLFMLNPRIYLPQMTQESLIKSLTELKIYSCTEEPIRTQNK